MNPPETAHRRVDRLTGRSVLVASERSRRPIVSKAISTGPPEAAFDPFLEGHESETPDERLALRRADSIANQPGWLVRVVANRFSAVSDLVVEPNGRSTGGVHDVVIECPDKRTQMAELSTSEVGRVLEAWQRRIVALRATAGVESIHVFRNEGAAAGASLPHCHSQILATSFVPDGVARAVNAARDFSAEDSTSLYRSWLDDELTKSQRVVASTDSLAVVCPFASRMSWQARICPRRADDFDFGCVNEDVLLQISANLLAIVRGSTERRFADWNLVLTLGSVKQPLPWMIDVMPRTARLAGFELSTDAEIVTVAAETAAETYRRDWQLPQIGDAERAPPGFAWQSD